jgi:hypothetical protein
VRNNLNVSLFRSLFSISLIINQTIISTGKFCEKYYSQSSYLQKHIQQIHLMGRDSGNQSVPPKLPPQTQISVISSVSQQLSQNGHELQSQEAPKLQGGSLFECPLCSATAETTTDLILHLRTHC